MKTVTTHLSRWQSWTVAGLLVAGVFWLRWPTFGFQVWNVDEAIHAAAARTILEGGVLYRDVVDQRTPLSYYAVAALFKVTGENNVWAMHALASALIAATAFGLFLLGRSWRGTTAGLWAALLYVVFSSALFYPGDAYALNTEWFVAGFTTWAAWFAWRSSFATTGLLLGLAFLSKQPALLDLGAPLAMLAYVSLGDRTPWAKVAALLAGFLAPVVLVLAYFAAHGALADFHFYAWEYNLQYYGPEVSATERLISTLKPFQLLWAHHALVLIIGVGAAGFSCFRVMQRQPDHAEKADNPKLLYVLAWSVTSLAGAAAGGRGFDHYFIPLLPAGGLLSALGLNGVARWARAHRARRWWRPLAMVLGLLVLWQLGRSALATRRLPPLPVDPSWRVSAYIREHSAPDERIFVWGYHPDIYLFADRRPASRFVYASFLSGLIPWTNTAPGRDTAYAIVPGAREQLLHELATARPAFVVDCSAGPNRWWNKYPLDTFPGLAEFLRQEYQLVEAGQFGPQGFRLYQRRPAGSGTEAQSATAALPRETAATFTLGAITASLEPVRTSAPHGVNRSLVEGRLEYFMHAPATLVYRLPAGGGRLRGGYGLKPAAFAADNPAPTDGAEFIIRWRPAHGTEQVLLRRLLRPREEPADRDTQSFQVDLPAGPDGDLELVITAGPAESATSDWTYWSDLLLETGR